MPVLMSDTGEHVAEDLKTLKFGSMPETQSKRWDGLCPPMSAYEKVTITGDAALMLPCPCGGKIQVSIKVTFEESHGRPHRTLQDSADEYPLCGILFRG